MPMMHNRDVTAREATENLLKTVRNLHMRRSHAYVSEIAEELEMNLATVYSLVDRMVNDGFLEPLDRNGRGRRTQKQSVVLTAKGETLANSVMERHEALQIWLTRLGLPPSEADQEACVMEHGLTERTMELLRSHVSWATKMTGDPRESAESIMRKIADGELPNPMQTLTVSEQTMRMVEQLGGTEGMARLRILIDRVGGEAALERLLDELEEIGGVERIRKDSAELQSLQAFVRRLGGPAALESMAELTRRAGGRTAMRNLVELSERVGGYRRLMKLTEGQLRLWTEIFEQKSEKN